MITTKLDNGKSHYMLMDAGEIPGAAKSNSKWMRHQTTIWRHEGYSIIDFERKSEVGDVSMVYESNKYLEKLESQIPHSLGWLVVEDVVGAVPNVPAMIAGIPQHMRRRVRTSKDNAPLTIFMNLTSSQGISKSDVRERGIVMLALVRMLANIRPVELWVGTAMGDMGVNCTVAWKIDTAPMDLARAAFHIADPSMSRLFGYAMCESMPDKHIGGFFSGDNKAELKMVAGWHDVVYVPEIRYQDPLTTDPVGWIKRVLDITTEQED